MIEIANELFISRMIQSLVSRMEQIGIENSCVIGILKGGVYTTQNILNNFPDYAKKRVLVGFLGLSSYRNGTETQGKIDITYPLDIDPKQSRGRICWIVDDIYDSGLTMIQAKSIIEETADFKTIHSAVLVRKMNPKIKKWKKSTELPFAVGLEYEGDSFLVGSGMGMGEKYRCLDGIHELEPDEIEEM